MRAIHCHILDVPNENAAEAVLAIEHDWPQLRHFTSIRTLVVIYNFDSDAIEAALQALLRRGLLEVRKQQLGKSLCRQTVAFYRRKSLT